MEGVLLNTMIAYGAMITMKVLDAMTNMTLESRVNVKST